MEKYTGSRIPAECQNSQQRRRGAMPFQAVTRYTNEKEKPSSRLFLVLVMIIPFLGFSFALTLSDFNAHRLREIIQFPA